MITRGIAIASNGMQSLLDMNDSIAHNLANVNTVGYKKAALTFKSVYEARVEQPTDQKDIKNTGHRYIGNLSMGSETDRSIIAFTQGTLDRTGNKTDVAIDGDGFFKVKDADGNIYYTRNGQFTIDSKKRLTTLDGDTVLDINSKPIQIDLEATNAESSDIVFRENGEIGLSNEKISMTLQRMAIVDLVDKENIRSMGNAKFAPADSQTNQEIPAVKFKIQQGALELSNSSTITEMINSINVSRNYETLSKLVKEDGDLLTTAINLGRIR